LIRRKQLTAATNRDRWLISYADFITLLLALFVVLFASSRPDKSRAREVANAVTAALHQHAPAHPETSPPLKTSLDDLEHRLTPEIQAGKVAVHLESRGLVISLREAAYFPSGGDEIARAEYDSLGQIADAIRGVPNAVALEGHTDSSAIHSRRFRSNWELSAARSIAVLMLFEGRFGIPADRFAVTGYAETKPVASNDSPEGRAQNRRVDIVILNG
jgi:chemotaxis protein MotB